MIEFAVVGPIVTLLGLAILQYGMMFFAKNQMNHAAFMAARAGSTGNAKLDAVVKAYKRALVPLYGGGLNAAELAVSYAKAEGDVDASAKIELLNPTKESFTDFNDASLQQKYGARAIPNGGQAYKSPTDIGANSGQSIQDANLIKLRITHGYEPKVLLVKQIYTTYLKWMDTHTDAFHTALVEAGRVPIVTNVTLQMQSDPIEDANVSSPGMGNNGNATNPGDPAVVTTDPPNCLTIGCTVSSTPIDPGGGGCPDGGDFCPVCHKREAE